MKMVPVNLRRELPARSFYYFVVDVLDQPPPWVVSSTLLIQDPAMMDNIPDDMAFARVVMDSEREGDPLVELRLTLSSVKEGLERIRSLKVVQRLLDLQHDSTDEDVLLQTMAYGKVVWE